VFHLSVRKLSINVSFPWRQRGAWATVNEYPLKI
jgi:hypothetical protein